MTKKKVTTIFMNQEVFKELKMFAVQKELPLSEAIKELLENYKKQKENILNVGQ